MKDKRTELILGTPSKTPATRVDQFFTGTEARFDRWRTLLQSARAWEAASTQQRPEKEKHLAEIVAALPELRQWENFFAYPGHALLSSLEERISSGDATGAARLAQCISAALLTHSYRTNVGDWESEEQSSINFGERVTNATEESVAYRPYFEVLVVSPAHPTAWPELAQDLRKLRRPQDKFVYEPVFVGSFEDAVLASILNGNIEAVIIYEGIPLASAHDNPILREFLTSRLAESGIGTNSGQYSLALAQGLKQLRPELDIYFLSDRQVEKLAGDVSASCIRRVF